MTMPSFMESPGSEYDEPGLPEDSLDPAVEALIDTLGPEKFEEVLLAIQQFPVVAELAEMAVFTRDGEVTGTGGSTEDMVPARLSPNEFVFSAEAVNVLGIDALEDLHEQAKRQAAAQI